MITVGEANPSELPSILELTLAAYGEYEKELSAEGWAGYRQNIEESILNNERGAILVARDESLLGSVLFCEPNTGRIADDYPEMRLLAVDPKFRDRGIGGILITECENRARSYGGLTLHTTRLMQTAKAMYERRGYERYPKIDFVPRPDFVVWGYKKTFNQTEKASR